MSEDIERRIERLLDQLDSPNLSDREIEQIKGKIQFLQEMQS